MPHIRSHIDHISNVYHSANLGNHGAKSQKWDWSNPPQPRINPAGGQTLPRGAAELPTLAVYRQPHCRPAPKAAAMGYGSKKFSEPCWRQRSKSNHPTDPAFDHSINLDNRGIKSRRISFQQFGKPLGTTARKRSHINHNGNADHSRNWEHRETPHQDGSATSITTSTNITPSTRKTVGGHAHMEAPPPSQQQP